MFTIPKHFNEKPFFTNKRLPRKLKKKIKKSVPKYVFKMGVNVVLWYTMEENYKRFIIEQITKIYN